MTVQSRSSSNTIIAIIIIAAIVIIGLFLLQGRSGQPGATSSPKASETASASAEASPSASASASATPSGGSPAASSSAGELKIEATEYKFSAPTQVQAGVTRIVVDNVGKEDHQAEVAKIADGKTFADLTAALQQPDPSAALKLLSLNGGPTGVAPGAKGTTTSNLAPGQYAFLCFMQSADGVPHFAKGMIAPLEVTGTASNSPLPTGDANLSLQDYSFGGLTSLSAGHHTVTVTNKGPQPHEATIVKLNEGTTVEQVQKYFTTTPTPSGPPPWTNAGGIAGIAPGTTASMEVDLAAGDYALICFIPDQSSGKPHAALGMVAGLKAQ